MNALKKLQTFNITTIEIKKADKSNTFVIMDKDIYKEKLVLEGHLLTPTYEPADVHAKSRLQKFV